MANIIIKQNTSVAIENLKRSNLARKESKVYWDKQWASTPASGNSQSPRCGRSYIIAKEAQALSELMLDIGCGDLQETAQGEIGDKYIGIDVSPMALKRAARRHSAANFIVADASHLPLKDAGISVSCALEMLMHLGEDVSSAISEMVRVTNNMMIFTLRHKDAILENARGRRKSSSFTSYKNGTLKNGIGLMAFSESDVYSLLSKHGFENFRMEVACQGANGEVKNLLPGEEKTKQLLYIEITKKPNDQLTKNLDGIGTNIDLF